MCLVLLIGEAIAEFDSYLEIVDAFSNCVEITPVTGGPCFSIEHVNQSIEGFIYYRS